MARILLSSGFNPCVKHNSSYESWQLGQNGLDGENIFAASVEAVGALDKIEALQEHADEAVYEKAVSILETFFDVDDVEGEEGAPAEPEEEEENNN